ncbi:MAG: PaaI family thioesterase [Bacillota bacterium]
MTAWQQELISLFRTSPVANYFGMTLEFGLTGNSLVSLPYNPNLNHAMGGVHGGVVATLLDCAGWFACAARHEGIWIATSEFKVNLLEPAVGRDLRAEGRLVRGGRRLDVAEMNVTDQEGKLYAVGLGTFVVREDLPFRMDSRQGLGYFK